MPFSRLLAAVAMCGLTGCGSSGIITAGPGDGPGGGSGDGDDLQPLDLSFATFISGPLLDEFEEPSLDEYSDAIPTEASPLFESLRLANAGPIVEIFPAITGRFQGEAVFLSSASPASADDLLVGPYDFVTANFDLLIVFSGDPIPGLDGEHMAGRFTDLTLNLKDGSTYYLGEQFIPTTGLLIDNKILGSYSGSLEYDSFVRGPDQVWNMGGSLVLGASASPALEASEGQGLLFGAMDGFMIGEGTLGSHPSRGAMLSNFQIFVPDDRTTQQLNEIVGGDVVGDETP